MGLQLYIFKGMKGFTLILSLLVLFLSTQCMEVTQNTVQPMPGKKKTSCCAKKTSCEKPVQEKADNKGCKDVCNPFMACSGCIYTAFESPEYNFSLANSAPVKNGYKPADLIPDYISSLWHPPECS